MKPVTAIAVSLLAAACARDLCRNEEVERVASPDRRVDAVLFQRDCGATTGFSTQVTVVPVGQAIAVEPESVFVADSDRGKAPAAAWGGPMASIAWAQSGHLVVPYDARSRVFQDASEIVVPLESGPATIRIDHQPVGVGARQLDAGLVAFHYELTGAGWAEAKISIGKKSTTVTASYLSDALGDLAHAAIAVLRDRRPAAAVFTEEPGEYLWVLMPRPADRLELHITFEQVPIGKSVVLEGECSLRDFAAAVLSELERLEGKHGRDGYQELWVEYPFPAQQLEELRNLLGG